MDVEAVRRICPPCADSMAAKNIRLVKRSVIAKQLADAIKTTFGVGHSGDGQTS
jgi:hypothetical protein